MSRRFWTRADVASLRRRLRRARRFPTNTDPSSRHVETMAYCLLRYGDYAMFRDEPEHCAVSLLVTVEHLYKARDEIERLTAKLRAAAEGK